MRLTCGIVGEDLVQVLLEDLFAVAVIGRGIVCEQPCQLTVSPRSSCLPLDFHLWVTLSASS